MNTYFKKNPQQAMLIMMMCGAFTLPVAAEEANTQPPKNLTGSVIPSATDIKTLAEQKHQIIDEAAEVVEDTQKALVALERNDPKKAQFLLQGIPSILDSILGKYPNFELVSADTETHVIEFEGDAQTAKKAIDLADDFLDDGKIQEARQILAELRSEVKVTQIGIPLKTFPSAIKQAMVFLSMGKNDKAASTLYDVLNALDESIEVMPLPVMRAELLLTDASEIEHRADLSHEQSRSEVMKLAEAAKGQLDFARLLGYGNKEDYKLLYTAIDEIEKTIFSEKSAATWAAIKQHIAALKTKLTFFEK